MTTLVEELTRVTELDRMEANARGIKSFEALIFFRRARPRVMGTKSAVVAVLLINALRTAAETMITANKRFGLWAMRRRTARPTMSTTPVRVRAAVRISRPNIMITASLPKPANACLAGNRPLRMSVNKMPSAMTSAGSRSREKSTKATAMTKRSNAICKVMIPEASPIQGTRPVTRWLAG